MSCLSLISRAEAANSLLNFNILYHCKDLRPHASCTDGSDEKSEQKGQSHRSFYDPAVNILHMLNIN